MSPSSNHCFQSKNGWFLDEKNGNKSAKKQQAKNSRHSTSYCNEGAMILEGLTILCHP